MKTNDKELAAAYVRYYREGAEADEWALDELHELAIDQPERAWNIIKIINTIPIEDEAWREFVHGMLGCGALEELVALHEESMLPVITEAAKSDPVLRSELTTIYESSISPNAWSQIRVVLGRK